MRSRECPRHPGRPLDACERCDRLIAEREFERDHGEERWQEDQDRFERSLDAMGGSR